MIRLKFFYCLIFLSSLLCIGIYATDGTNNSKTLQAYENNINAYIDNTPRDVAGDFKLWIDKALSLLQPNSVILEIGSAFGRDARYMESKGYQVIRTDAVISFVSYLKDQGYEAQFFNIVADEFSSSFDMLFANAVFLHFSRNELSKILIKSYHALNSDGFLVFSLKKGVGEEWTNQKGLDRYFCYWIPEELINFVKIAGFKIIDIEEKDIWIRIIAQK